jgi:hypothetical protein
MDDAPEPFEGLLREKFERIRDLALDALDMLDAQARGDTTSPSARPGEPTWMVGQIANEVIDAERIISEFVVDDDDDEDEGER